MRRSGDVVVPRAASLKPDPLAILPPAPKRGR